TRRATRPATTIPERFGSGARAKPMNTKSNSSPWFRVTLAVVLAALAARNAQAQSRPTKSVEEWLQQLKDSDAAKRREAVVALGSFGPDLSKAAIRTLGTLLKDNDAHVRHAAALSLGNYGPAAKVALGPVREAVKDSVPT